MKPSIPTWVILAILVGYFAIGQFHRAAGSVTTPLLIERLTVGATAISLVMAIMFFASVVTQLPMGAALDKIGARTTMALTTLCVALGTAVFAIADDYTQFLLARVLMGIGFAAGGAATNVIIARAFPARDFAYTQGRVVAFGAIGGLMGTYPLAVSLERAPWSVVFLVLTVLTVVLALAIYRLVPKAPEKTADSVMETGGYLELLKSTEMLKIMTLAIVAYAPIVVITGLWGSAYFQEIHGLRPEAAGGLIFAFYGATIVGAFGFGWLERRTAQRKRLILAAAFGSATCFSALALVPNMGVVLTGVTFVVMVTFQQFHVALSAHLRAVVPAAKLGRGSALFSLVAVVAIPSMQLGFGAVLDLAELAGLSRELGYRIGFGLVGLIVIGTTLVYATARQANET
ncbi:MAG: MFS transporter [Pseudomonadota bacterium]